MSNEIQGLHHLTAMCGDAQANLDFYVRVLGLRLVKVTVNYDDPETYHLYYGDGFGRPGTILTFFPTAGTRGLVGIGQIGAVSLSVPHGSMPAWSIRLRQHGMTVSEPFDRMDDTVLKFTDPDGLQLELIEDKGDDRPGDGSTLPPDMAIRGLHSVTQYVSDISVSTAFLNNVLGAKQEQTDGNRTRFRFGDSQPGSIVDLVGQPGGSRGKFGAGVVHHVAFRILDDSAQQSMLTHLRGQGIRATPVQDRTYFHSIYFREPGGVLYEIATNSPGFDIDETILGSGLRLPPWLEGRREQIVSGLTSILTPSGVKFP